MPDIELERDRQVTREVHKLFWRAMLLLYMPNFGPTKVAVISLKISKAALRLPNFVI